mmetsp:Transcript_17815/g.31551  ORF Transcript_17815/g.31551 Transcript_17815/m.31551 type:complete len:527 (+) Transcript_17815:107-1687(+)
MGRDKAWEKVEDLAVPLFERGYSEAQVEEALAHVSTLDEAIEYLNTGKGKKGKATETSKTPAPVVATERPVRRRACKKGAQVLEAEQPAAPTPVEPTPSEAADSVCGGDASTTAASTPMDQDLGPAVPTTADDRRALAAEAEEAHTPPPVRRARTIEPNEEGKQWWMEAAVRWPKIVQNIRLEAYRNILRPGCPLADAYLGKVKRQPLRVSLGGELQTPARKRAGNLEEDGSAKRMRQADSAVLGSVPTPSRSSAAGLAANCSCSSPSSPQCMQLNSQADCCTICCCDTQPWRSVRLGCGHGWYCASCMLRHSEARLEVGATSIACPECYKDVPEKDLRKLLPTETLDRLLARSLEQAVSAAADLWACPTPNCPMRVALEDGELARFQCTLCNKTSCLRCGRQPYHRGMTCEDVAQRLNLKGKKAKQDKENEEMLAQWMTETGTKQCPTCRTGVTKQNLDKQGTQYAECHKMCCRNCKTKFCFKCLSVLSDSFTCGCTINAHGFIDPSSGKRMNHLDRRKKVQKRG